MNFLQSVFEVLMLLFIVMAFTIIYTAVANYVGEKLGFGELFKYIWKKISRKRFRN